MTKATVFIGDLSRFCSDEDISSLFHRFGKVLETKIMRNPVTGISLGYGFLIMSSTESAFLAMQCLHGVQLRGRPLRVKWAGRNIKNDAGATPPPRFPRDTPAEAVINSVHVRFQALHISSCLFTEESLYQFFLPFGEVIDASIKESNVDEATGLQHGYGFVHFNSTADGAQSAFRAIMELSGDAYFSLHCEGSRNFMKQFHGNQAALASPPVSKPCSSTPTRSTNLKFRSPQSTPTPLTNIAPPYRDYSFQTGTPYYNQSAPSQIVTEVHPAYLPTPYMNPSTNVISNNMYCYSAPGPYCTIPSTGPNIAIQASPFPAQTNIPTYPAYDSYPPNYNYFPAPVHGHVPHHSHNATGTAGPTAKPSYLSYNINFSPKVPGQGATGLLRGPTTPKDQHPPSHLYRPDDKIPFDKRAHARHRSYNKSRSDALGSKQARLGTGTGEIDLNLVPPSVVEPHRDLPNHTFTTKVAPV